LSTHFIILLKGPVIVVIVDGDLTACTRSISQLVQAHLFIIKVLPLEVFIVFILIILL
jgi:hypothetical protein